MNWELILTIVFAVISAVGGFATYYASIKRKIAEAIAQNIDIAEVDGAVGAEKKAEVILQLKKLIPAFLKPFISEGALDVMVQKVFDSIESYAKKQVEKKKAELEKQEAEEAVKVEE